MGQTKHCQYSWEVSSFAVPEFTFLELLQFNIYHIIHIINSHQTPNSCPQGTLAPTSLAAGYSQTGIILSWLKYEFLHVPLANIQKDEHRENFNTGSWVVPFQ